MGRFAKTADKGAPRSAARSNGCSTTTSCGGFHSLGGTPLEWIVMVNLMVNPKIEWMIWGTPSLGKLQIRSGDTNILFNTRILREIHLHSWVVFSDVWGYITYQYQPKGSSK